jgi:hypothetical protein
MTDEKFAAGERPLKKSLERREIIYAYMSLLIGTIPDGAKISLSK